MSSEGALAFFLALTVALLGCVVATGLKARRRWHITFVVLAVGSLATAIACALRVGKHYDLPSAGVITPIHRAIAMITTACYLLPIATGLLTIFKPATRRLHRKLAFLVLAMTALTAITGTMMLMMAKKIA